jgi:hypothetical protein
MKLAFFRFLLWMAEYELAISLGTGRNRHSTALARDDVMKLQRVVHRLEIQT